MLDIHAVTIPLFNLDTETWVLLCSSSLRTLPCVYITTKPNKFAHTSDPVSLQSS